MKKMMVVVVCLALVFTLGMSRRPRPVQTNNLIRVLQITDAQVVLSETADADGYSHTLSSNIFSGSGVYFGHYGPDWYGDTNPEDTWYETIGFYHFQSVSIPPGTTIAGAELSYYEQLQCGAPTIIRIHVVSTSVPQNRAELLALVSSSNYIEWTLSFEECVGRRASVDFGALMQEVVSGAGWNEGDQILVIFEGVSGCLFSSQSINSGNAKYDPILRVGMGL